MGCCKSRRRRLEPDVDYDADFRDQHKATARTYRCPGGHEMEELVTQKPGYLRCDVCGRAQDMGRRMQGCWDCDYHVCQRCSERFEDAEWYASWLRFWHVETPSAPSAPEVSSPRCPGNHELQQYFNVKAPPLQCDICGRRLAPYTRVWGCTECNYDVGPCCEEKFQDADFLSSWRAYWSLPAPEPPQEELPLPPPLDPPTTSSLSSVPEIQVTRAKPQPVEVHEELRLKQEESTKAMVLGGKNEVVAPALMTAVLHGPSSKKSSRAVDDPAVLKFAKKGRERSVRREEKRPRKTREKTEVIEEVPVDAKDDMPTTAEVEAREVKVEVEETDENPQDAEKKRKKEKKEKKEKSEKKEKKHKKDEREGEGEKEERRHRSEDAAV